MTSTRVAFRTTLALVLFTATTTIALAGKSWAQGEEGATTPTLTDRIAGKSWAQGEEGATTLTLTDRSPHRLWVVDTVFTKIASQYNGDTGKVLAILSGGATFSHIQPTYSLDGNEIYQVETHYSRTWYGERTDIVAVYDAKTLATLGEVVIPPKHAWYPPFQSGTSALSDNGRFLAAFNLTPATSVSIVDVTTRKFISEVNTPGCSMVFAAGERQFAMLCGDGSVSVLALNEDGSKSTQRRSARFFNPEKDPITEKGERYKNTWVFASFEGYLHQVDVAANPPKALKPWSLFTAEERAEGWRIGGKQHLAVNESHGLLYSMVNQNGAHAHKDPGKEIWVYDLKTKKRVRRIDVSKEAEYGVDMIAVSRDAKPVLFAAGGFPLKVSVYDAVTGAHLRNLDDPGLLGTWLIIP